MTPRTLARMMLAALLWGVPYLLVALTIDDIPAIVTVFARSALGAAVLVPLVARRGGLGVLRARRRPVMWLALLDLTIPALLITIGIAAIPSSLAGTLIASVPILVALMAIRLAPGESASGLRLMGLVTGIAGVGLLLGVEVSGDARALVGALLVLAGALSYAGGALFYQRRLGDLPPLTVVAGTLLASAAITAVPAAASLPHAVPSPGALAALVALSLGCTGVGYVLFYGLIADIGAGRASVITYLAPAVAVVLGVVVLDEPLTAGIVAGLLLVLAGAWLASGGRPPEAQPVGAALGVPTGREAHGGHGADGAGPPVQRFGFFFTVK